MSFDALRGSAANYACNDKSPPYLGSCSLVIIAKWGTYMRGLGTAHVCVADLVRDGDWIVA